MTLENVSPTSPLGVYLSALRQEVQAGGVEFILSPGATVPYVGQGIEVSGYFVENPRPTLAVATGKPFEDWIPILVHEGCHMDQWREGALAWTQNIMSDGQEAVDWLDAWCAGKRELSSEDLALAIARAKQVELDCERRVVEKIKRFGLPLDIPTYIQRANAYVQFYEHVGKTRAWNPPGKAPYQVEEVWRQSPVFFVDQPTPAMEQAFEAFYPKKPAPASMKP